MHPATVIFCHGKESGPWGVKIRHLAKIAESYGLNVISQDDRDTLDPELRAERLVATAEATNGPVILAGSSMGGYVAAKASAEIQPLGLFLMAPAIAVSGYLEPDPEPASGTVTIVHGWDDTVIPPEPVVDYSKRHRVHLVMIPASHSLLEGLTELSRVFSGFLQSCLAERPYKNALARLLATV